MIREPVVFCYARPYYEVVSGSGDGEAFRVEVPVTGVARSARAGFDRTAAITTKRLVNKTTVNAMDGRKKKVCPRTAKTCNARTAVISPRGNMSERSSVSAGPISRIDQ